MPSLKILITGPNEDELEKKIAGTFLIVYFF
jgi:hypothetical protein